MAVLSRDQLSTLVKHQNQLSLSFFLPTYKTGKQVRQNHIMLKNLLREARDKLEQKQIEGMQIEELLAPLSSLVNEASYWERQGNGALAFYRAPDFFQTVEIPTEDPNWENHVIVNSRFSLRPLLPYLLEDQTFYLLLLSQKQVRFFEGSRFLLNEHTLEEVPRNIQEGTPFVEEVNELQYHVLPAQGVRKALSRGTAIFHGHGVSEDTHKDRIREFLQRVEAGVTQFLENKQAPLILAGVDYLVSMYKDINSYPLVYERKMTGNFDRLPESEIHNEAILLLAPYFYEKQERELKRFYDTSGSNMVSLQVPEIVTKAFHGQVESLFMQKGGKIWGSFDEDTGQCKLSAHKPPESEDLIDIAVIQTMAHGGNVFPLELERMPEGAPLAAIYRY